MDWIEIKIETTTEGVEPITGLALMAGINGLAVDDPKDLREYLASPKAARWDYVEESLLAEAEAKKTVTVTVYVADNAQGRGQWRNLRGGLEDLKMSDAEGVFGSLTRSLAGVKEEDWANNWKAYFKPFEVGEKLLVKPTWEPPGDTGSRAVLEIDPGSSFGTGQHHTTRLCLEMLEKAVTPGMEVLDLGCGSGILMIAALLLGASRATGADVEENAIRTAGENLKQNGLGPERYALYAGDLTGEPELRRLLGWGRERADLISVNIVADVILAMTPYFAGFLKPGGQLLVSGIIDGRTEEVSDALAAAGFTLTESRSSGEWNAFLFGK